MPFTLHILVMPQIRGRPKGQVNRTTLRKKNSPPLGVLIRGRRLELGLGLSEVADRCGCSLQFISNIEHGRATLPWGRIAKFAHALKIETGSLHAANLSGRSDFREAMKKDPHLLEIIRRYQQAKPAAKKRFVISALKLLS